MLRGAAVFIPLGALLFFGPAVMSGSEPDTGRDSARKSTLGFEIGSQAGMTTAIQDTLRTPSGTAIRVMYRNLIPGEAVLFRLEEDGAAARAVVSFLG